MSEVRSEVPVPRVWIMDGPTFRRPVSSRLALEAAAWVVHVYANTGPWDGGVQLEEAIRVLARNLDPLMDGPETEKAPG